MNWSKCVSVCVCVCVCCPQGPLRNTCGHFWLMIWEQKTKAVIMLNRVIEKGSVSRYNNVIIKNTAHCLLWHLFVCCVHTHTLSAEILNRQTDTLWQRSQPAVKLIMQLVELIVISAETVHREASLCCQQDNWNSLFWQRVHRCMWGTGTQAQPPYSFKSSDPTKCCWNTQRLTLSPSLTEQLDLSLFLSKAAGVDCTQSWDSFTDCFLEIEDKEHLVQIVLTSQGSFM